MRTLNLGLTLPPLSFFLSCLKAAAAALEAEAGGEGGGEATEGGEAERAGQGGALATLLRATWLFARARRAARANREMGLPWRAQSKLVRKHAFLITP